VTEGAQKRLLEQISDFQAPDLAGTVAIAGVDQAYTARTIGDSFIRTDPDGVFSTVQPYLVMASANEGNGYATVERIIDLTATPLFQYMIFYDDDLELLPGPNMILEGRVHANGDIYVGCGGTLTVDSDYFRCTGDILRKRKNDGSESTGTVNIKVQGDTTFKTLTNAEDAEYGDWTNYALDRWKGTVQDGSHGVKEIAVPDIGSIKAFRPDGSKGYFHENAGLVIVDDRVYDGAGNPINLAGIVTEKSMYDARERKTVTVTEIDMAQLNASGHFPANGLIYAYRTDADSAHPNGVRLVNGEQLAGSLTVASEDPIYVKGDFNTLEKKGCAVISDAVNLLSGSWSDTGGTMQKASPTWYNMAMITGNVPTPDGGGDYSGGFENLPRFHENWNNVKATIRGSFINMFESEIAKSPWGLSGVYNPPIRDWRYDPDLRDMKNLPPFTPNAISFQRVLWDDKLPSLLAGS
ncbi:MAG: hypothetical protein JXA90_06645, partial [Planctomycetes bacterium]|nr:hypothetical protein [Planctomycetota bacterium]